MFIFVLSGLFCCLGFSGVFFLLFGRGRVLFFAVWAGAQAPPKQKKKKKTRPRPKQQKKTHAPAPSGHIFVLLFGRVGVFVFCCLDRGACSFFCCLGGGRVLFFAVWAVVLFFLLFGPGARFFFFFFCLGRGACSFFFAVWAEACFFSVWAGGVFFLLFGRVTGVHSLTGLPGSSLSDPTTKKTKQQKKKNGFLRGPPKAQKTLENSAA